MKGQTDKELGHKIKKRLMEIKKDTPICYDKIENLHNEEKIDLIQSRFKDIMETLGLDLTNDSLKDTPKRIAKMYVNEFFTGLDWDNFPKCTTVKNEMQYDEMVLVKTIKVMSNCEHHFVIIDGVADVAYIPKNRILGLSKINRIVDFFCRRPQIQERLGEQICEALKIILETDDVAVRINAVHYCVKSRGVEDQNSSTTTSKLSGRFKTEDALRNEFLKCAE